MLLADRRRQHPHRARAVRRRRPGRALAGRHRAAPHRRRDGGRCCAGCWPAPGTVGRRRRHRACARPCRRCCTRCARCARATTATCRRSIVEPGVQDRRAGADRQPQGGRHRPDRQRPGRRELYGGPCDRRRLRHLDEVRRGVDRRASTSAAPSRRASRSRSRRWRPAAPSCAGWSWRGRGRSSGSQHGRGAAVGDPLRLRRPGRRRRDPDGRRASAGRRPGRRDGDRDRRAGPAGARRGRATIDVHEPWLTLIGLRLVFERNRS